MFERHSFIGFTGLAQRIRWLVVVVGVWFAQSQPIFAFTTWGPLPPLSQRIADHEIALVATCVSVKRDYPNHDDARQAEIGTSVFQIEWISKGPAGLAPDQQIVLHREPVKLCGVRYLLFGDKSAQRITWDVHGSLSPAMMTYLQEAPDPQAPPERSLPYYFRFLESSNPEIAADAFEVFAQAGAPELKAGAMALPVEQVRAGLQNPDLSIAVQGIYSLLLGYCGDESDAPLMKELILEQSDLFRVGLERMIQGYLLLSRDRGLDILDEHKLRNKQVTFSETFAAMQALRFMWHHGEGRIAPARLTQSMRILLDRPELADLVIADLMRWKDWSIQDKLMQMYRDRDYNQPAVKRMIIRYFIAGSQDRPLPTGSQIPQHAIKSSQCLQELRRQDPKNVAASERFFRVP